MISNKVIIQPGSSKRRSVTINGDLMLLTTNSGPIMPNSVVKFKIFNNCVTMYSTVVITLQNRFLPTIPIIYRGIVIDGGIIIALHNVSDKRIYNKLKFYIEVINLYPVLER